MSGPEAMVKAVELVTLVLILWMFSRELPK